MIRDGAAAAPARERKRRRPDQTADRLREQIIAANLQPGSRVPGEWIDPQTLGVSRGTAREALKILAVQGLVESRSGPGGGVFVAAVRTDDAIRMLDNLFLFEAPTIADIYALRKVIEPELAASVAGRLSETDLAALHATIRLYEDEPATAADEYQQRLAELDFHAELARRSDNRVLGFICIFMVSLLRDMTVCREIYHTRNPSLRESGLTYQVQLLRAIKAGRSKEARDIMARHMVEAEAYMLDMAQIRRRGAGTTS
ncbi:FadR/GntR family transcriptional regulator [Pseudohoeflea coraliihabitans]|uniref:FCD domain-containing protein n=1 Tax=Pseudohoeflea coraliihabitans TaxID=2860393 RepID=A0ABS6WR97_9HYPH|nr:FCD domain-containing protein [Pseudohoeflea sp. DP4N28-3]MBW3097932.1 FCD domain-containing protein [Pseudohoeflea sp. DP4N28-3]